MTRTNIAILTVFLLTTCAGLGAEKQNPDARALVDAAFNYMRGEASVSTVDMTIHRPNWHRVMTMKAWTRGQNESIFWIMAPPKDRGNGTLLKKREMWMYNPKVDKVIKLPPSMMAQAWMGSDFSNNDLSKSDTLITDYIHTVIGSEKHDGMKVSLIKSMPKPEAPVIWGMQKLKIREDHILLSEEFYDEDLLLVKTMTTSEIRMMGGKLFPCVWSMKKADKKDEFTRLEYRELIFKKDLPNRVFTLSNLRNPKR